MSGIKNKVVAITGASSGIGEATALLLAERGATVVLGARGLDRLAALADRMVRTGGQAAYAPTDVRRRDDHSALVKLACERYGKLDVFVNIASIAGHKTVPNMAVYSGTKFAVRAISEGLRQEAGDQLRVTIISPGMVRTNFAEGVTSQTVKAQLEQSRDTFAMPADAIARAIAFAIEQPSDVDVNEIVVRPTAQK